MWAAGNHGFLVVAQDEGRDKGRAWLAVHTLPAPENSARGAGRPGRDRIS